MGSNHKTVLSMLAFHKALFMILLFSWYSEERGITSSFKKIPPFLVTTPFLWESHLPDLWAYLEGQVPFCGRHSLPIINHLKRLSNAHMSLKHIFFSKLGLITYKQLLISLEQPKQSLTSGALIQLKIPDLLKTPLTKMQI